MANQRRDRRRDNPQNDWDWYYYEYSYSPNDRDFYNQDYYDRDYYDNNMYYGRNYDYNRNDFGTENDYYGSRRGGREYNRDYDRNSRQGRFWGYGPRDYHRSDERILEDVNDRLTWHSMIDASDISVAVKDGIVTLTGSVDTRSDKRLAEDIADDVRGVWDVDNRLSVRNKGQLGNWRAQANRAEFRPGMEVIDSDGNHVGAVKEVRNGDFLVNRPMSRDVYVPFGDCNVTADGKVQLNVRADQIDQQAWMMPEAVASSTQQSRNRR